MFWYFFNKPLVANDNQLVNSFHEATSFYSTFILYILKVDKACQSYYQNPYSGEFKLYHVWEKKHQKYIDTVFAWHTSVITTINKTHSDTQKAASIRNNIDNIIDSSSNKLFEDFFNLYSNDMSVSCKNFEDMIVSGKYDIVETTPKYEILQQLVDFIDKSKAKK